MKLAILLLAISFFGCVDECLDQQPSFPGSEVEMDKLVFAHERTCAASLCISYGDASLVQYVESAQLDWSAGTMYSVVFGEAGCRRLQIVMADNEDPVIEDAGCPRAYSSDGTIYLNGDRMCGSRIFHAVIRHEIGHYLGIGHFEDMNSLMYRIYSKHETPVSVQTDVVQMFMDANKCNIYH